MAECGHDDDEVMVFFLFKQCCDASIGRLT